MKKIWLTLGDYVIALLLGAGLTFAFAPYEIFPLAIIAPAGLLALWLNKPPKQAFWLGFLFGAGLFGAGVYWVFISIHTIGDVPTPLAILITSGMIAILSMYPALNGYFLQRFFPINNTTKFVCAYPVIWVFLEWVRSFAFTGFPWLLLGYSQTNSPLKGYAPLFSVYGISLALIISSGLLVNVLLSYKQKHYRTIYFSLLALVAIWAAGSLLSLIPWTHTQGKPIPVSLVQGNISQTLKWDPEHLQLSFDTYENLTEPLWSKSKLIIWPEAAIPLPLPDAETFVNKMDAKAKENNAYLIMGIPIPASNNTYYNSIVVLGKNNTNYSNMVYNKRQLVPFGEYTPLSHLFSNLLQFMDIPMSNMVSGKINQTTLKFDDLQVLASICYEIAYPELIKTSNKEISFILTVTNDAWFGKSNAEAQHLQMAQMRALELHRPAVFVSNDGITALIDEKGRVQTALPQFETGVLTASLQPMYGITPWMKNGMEPLFFILICLLVAAILSARRTKRSSH